MEEARLFIEQWLFWVGWGIILGLFPTWIWCVGRIAIAAEIEHKKVPRWLFILTGGNPKGKIRKESLIPPGRYKDLGSRVVSMISAIGILVLFHYIGFNDFRRGNWGAILLFESSFTLFFLLTWLLPAYFLGRYLRGLATRDDKESSRLNGQ